MLHLILALAFAALPFSDKLYVVERESGSLAVVEDGQKAGEIEGLGDLSHATVKFMGAHAYAISRDGYISKIALSGDAVVRRVKVGESGIGMTFFNDLVVVANYEPGDVVILDADLNIVKRIETGSRNVGIKARPPYLVFSLMDSDEIWVLDGTRGFDVTKKIEGAGDMPFDALLDGDRYIAGFFMEPGVGVLTLESLSYRKVDIKRDGTDVVFKVPHFGTWGVWEATALIPAVGEKKVHILDLEDIKLTGSIDLIGLPVFAAVSPDRRYAVVNYSGEMEDYITVIDLETMEVAEDIRAGKRVMHMRYSEDSERLYLSSYHENTIKTLRVGSWEVVGEAVAASPSGIFILPRGREKGE